MNDKTGLIIPTEEEASLLFRDTLRRFPCWRVSGMGKVKALACASELIHMHHCSRIILFGFAGSIKNLLIGHIIEPNVYIEGDMDASLIGHPYPNTIYDKSSDSKLLDNSIRSAIVTQDRFLIDNPYSFSNDIQYLATDMESYALAYFCQDNLTPFHTIRVISDVEVYID